MKSQKHIKDQNYPIHSFMKKLLNYSNEECVTDPKIIEKIYMDIS